MLSLHYFPWCGCLGVCFIHKKCRICFRHEQQQQQNGALPYNATNNNAKAHYISVKLDKKNVDGKSFSSICTDMNQTFVCRKIPIDFLFYVSLSLFARKAERERKDVLTQLDTEPKLIFPSTSCEKETSFSSIQHHCHALAQQFSVNNEGIYIKKEIPM